MKYLRKGRGDTKWIRKETRRSKNEMSDKVHKNNTGIVGTQRLEEGRQVNKVWMEVTGKAKKVWVEDHNNRTIIAWRNIEEKRKSNKRNQEPDLDKKKYKEFIEE
ncbi:hypothetical protein HHI36_012887 [Cryptolaemus montrouzieri]|uniref:Uncharacterized protein n=1 Tax=Cryptolaemus montrouzieri TaxID=559131 RepID=A0ABD2NFK5_9CUCU